MHVARQHRMYAGRQTRSQGSGMTRLSTRATMTKGAWIGDRPQGRRPSCYPNLPMQLGAPQHRRRVQAPTVEFGTHELQAAAGRRQEWSASRTAAHVWRNLARQDCASDPLRETLWDARAAAAAVVALASRPRGSLSQEGGRLRKQTNQQSMQELGVEVDSVGKLSQGQHNVFPQSVKPRIAVCYRRRLRAVGRRRIEEFLVCPGPADANSAQHPGKTHRDTQLGMAREWKDAAWPPSLVHCHALGCGSG